MASLADSVKDPTFPPPHAWARMEGLGNDFIVVHAALSDGLPPTALVKSVCDRHRGIGADGLLWLTGKSGETPRMVVLNADGSRPEMCGNGLRCATRYLVDRGLAPRDQVFTILTDAGPREVRLTGVERIEVELGPPELTPEALPAKPERAVETRTLPMGGHALRLEPGGPWVTLVSMGNPHAVAWQPDWTREDFLKAGTRLQHHPVFPEGVNLGWLRSCEDTSLVLEVWERGVGPTQACGTGAAAAAVVASLETGKHGTWRVQQPGGELACSWESPDDSLRQLGPARWIALGMWPVLNR